MNNRFFEKILFVFYPLSKLWEIIYRVRRFLFDIGYFKQNDYEVPVFSIGNLSLGGTGKTPFTLWLGRYLNNKNKSVMVLTRGYKGKLENSSGILKTDSILGYNPYDFGDEALVICRGLKNSSVVVGKNRSANLRHYFNEMNPDVVLLDDGYQHLKIKRNINFVLFDAMLPLEKYLPPPIGYLREGLTALKDADVIIIGRSDLVEREKVIELEKLLSKYCVKNVPVAKMSYRPGSVRGISYKEVMSLPELKGRKVICVTGIASPQSFVELLKTLEVEIIAEHFYPDHHYYSEDDLKSLLKIAQDNNAIIITTEKDIVKIRKVSQSKLICYIDIQVHFLEGQREIEKMIDSKIEA